MDIKSYLLGKKAGGGGGTITLQDKDITITSNGSTTVTKDSGYDGLGRVGITTNVQPNLESKSITITENGTTTVTPATGKDGLSEIEVTTNVSGGGADDYFVANVPSYHNNISSILKEVPELDLTNVTQFSFNGCKKLSKIAGLKNTNNLTTMNSMFFECMSLKEIPLFDTSNVKSMSYAFRDTIDITEIPLFNTSKVTNMENMLYCSYTEGQHGGSGLKTVPVLNTSKVTNMDYMFGGRRKMTDTSLDNILQMCINATSYTRTKTLYTLGFGNMRTEYPVSRIEALPHYQDFLDAGWTIGY